MIGAIAVVGILLLVVPGLLAPRPAEPTPRPSPTPDPHVVVTDAGTFVIDYEDGSVVVRRTVGDVTSELGRVSVPEAQQPAESGGSLRGAAGYAMVCPTGRADGPEKFMFGHIEFGTGLTYKGPLAAGQGAPDGLFLFAIRPGPITGAARIVVSSDVGSVGTEAALYELALTQGEEQPSGCWVFG